MDFKDNIFLEEGLGGYIISSIMHNISELLAEGRRKRMNLANKDFTNTDPTLFGADNPEEKVDKWIGQNLKGGQLLGQKKCETTPLSGYAKHIKIIQDFAHSSPSNFAQVIMFSPLSANTKFANHWDNFQVLMMILKHYFPNKVTKEEIAKAVASFNDKHHNMKFSVTGWKLETIADVWSGKESLFHELNKLAAMGDDTALVRRLINIQGVAPVKAGFIAQLLWGKAGCIDTHNIDIYSKVFPDMADDLEEKRWNINKGASEKNIQASVDNYMSTLGKLQKRGIGSQQLWDVWVDFVETMYVMITHHGRGYYDMQGAALEPSSSEYDALKGTKIPKTGIGKDGSAMIPVVHGKLGAGASATHIPMDPDDALKQFHHIYRKGQRGSDAAHAVAFHKDQYGRPIDQSLGAEPSALHYFGQAINGDKVDTDRIKDIISKRIADRDAKQRRKSVQQQPELGYD